MKYHRWVTGIRTRASRLLLKDPTWVTADTNQRLLIFLHIPKAAGSSMNSVLSSVYGKRFYNIANRTRLALESGIEKPSNVLALSGHFSFWWPQQLKAAGTDAQAFQDREVLTVAVVRDPVERVKSYYRFVTSSGIHRHYQATKGMDPTEFFAFLEDRDDGECWNQQSRLMAEERGGEVNLDRFFLCAPLDHLGDFCQTLADSLEWPETVKIPHRNRTNPSHGADQFSDHLIEMIEHRSKKDRRLFENVSGRFSERDFPAFDWIDSRG